MTQSSSKVGANRSPFATLVYVPVLLMTLYALAINNITFATNDYRSIVIQAIATSGLALVLVPVIWHRVPAAARGMLMLCVLVNLWTLFDAGGRRLPAVMGW